MGFQGFVGSDRRWYTCYDNNSISFSVSLVRFYGMNPETDNYIKLPQYVHINVNGHAKYQWTCWEIVSNIFREVPE